MDSNITFKKAFFGGFDREDVMNYIASLTDEFFKYKKETVKKLEEMKEKTAELETAYSALLEENKSLKDEINEHTDKEKEEKENNQPDIKELIESLTESMNVLISVLSVEEDSESEPDSKESENGESDDTLQQEFTDCEEKNAACYSAEASENDKDLFEKEETIDDVISKYL